MTEPVNANVVGHFRLRSAVASETGRFSLRPMLDVFRSRGVFYDDASGILSLWGSIPVWRAHRATRLAVSTP